MKNSRGIANNDITQFNGYAPNELLARLYDTLNTRKEYVMPINEIYLLSMILNEQILRYFNALGKSDRFKR